MNYGRTMFDKIWAEHVVTEIDGNALLYVDRVLLYEAGVRALKALSADGLTVRNPGQVLAVADHFVPGAMAPSSLSGKAREAVSMLEEQCARHGLDFIGLDHPGQGIVHVVGPETGFTLPGTTIVCTDSHTSTNGAFGCIAFGIGVTEIAHVMATQCIWQRKPQSMRITIDGPMPASLSAKDIILAVIGKIGTAGGTGFAIEFAGSTIRAMSLEARMTVCNMAIEAGARFGLIAPDEKTYQWLEGKQFAPKGADWTAAQALWRSLPSDPDARFDAEVTLDIADLAPMVTWGTSPEDVIPVTAEVPEFSSADDPAGQQAYDQKIEYMGVTPCVPIASLAIDRVFIGSCTNGRLEDLRAAAAVLHSRTSKVPGLVVPGSKQVRLAAEQEGLDRIFIDAGLVWGSPGCSMCCALNGDSGAPGERIASTSNRNFVGRQGQKVRTHLMSPAMVAAAAVEGRICDVRELDLL